MQGLLYPLHLELQPQVRLQAEVCLKLDMPLVTQARLEGHLGLELAGKVRLKSEVRPRGRGSRVLQGRPKLLVEQTGLRLVAHLEELAVAQVQLALVVHLELVWVEPAHLELEVHLELAQHLELGVQLELVGVARVHLAVVAQVALALVVAQMVEQVGLV